MPRTRAALDKSAVEGVRQKKKHEEDDFNIVKYEVKSKEQALELERLMIEIEEKTEELGSEHPTTLDVINSFSELSYTTREFVDAEEWFRKAWEGRLRAQTKYEISLKDQPGPASAINGYLGDTYKIYDLRIFYTQHRLAKSLEELLQYEEAELMYKESLAGLEHVLETDEHAELIPCVDGYAITLHKQGESRYADSLAMYRRLLSLQNKFVGELEQSSLEVVNRLATVLRDMGLLDEAEQLAMSSVENCTNVMGKDHPVTQQCVEIVAFIRHSQGKSEEAEDMFRLSLACNERLLGRGHPITLRTVVKIALLLVDQEYYDEALEMHQRGLTGLEKYYGPDHPEVIDQVQYVGELMLRAERIPEAETLFRRALAGRRALFKGAPNPKTMDSAHCLACLIQKQTKWKHDPLCARRIEEAERLYKEASSGRDLALGRDHEDSIETCRCLAAFLFEESRVLEAETLCKRVFNSRLDRYGEAHILTARAALAFGIILQNSRKFHRGIEVFRVAIRGFEVHFHVPSVEEKAREREKRRLEREHQVRSGMEAGNEEKSGENKGDDDDIEERLARLEEEIGHESDDDSDLPPELVDARLSYENCLRMNAIG